MNRGISVKFLGHFFTAVYFGGSSRQFPEATCLVQVLRERELTEAEMLVETLRKKHYFSSDNFILRNSEQSKKDKECVVKQTIAYYRSLRQISKAAKITLLLLGYYLNRKIIETLS